MVHKDVLLLVSMYLTVLDLLDSAAAIDDYDVVAVEINEDQVNHYSAVVVANVHQFFVKQIETFLCDDEVDHFQN